MDSSIYHREFMGSKPTVRPPKLRQGNRVALVAPAGPLLEKDDLTRAEALCRALGYEPTLGKNAYRRLGYLAGTDQERLADLNAALNDPSIDAIWCIRGGYGSIRLLAEIDYAAIAKQPKALIGFSDITALLNAITRSTGVVTFHGPVARTSNGCSRAMLLRASLAALLPRLTCSCRKKIGSSLCTRELPKVGLWVAT
jgi:muramoyltetrapeptide carboxypeptidase